MRGDDHEVETTPDGRYIIVRERLWRASNPALTEKERQSLVGALMIGRRAVAKAKRTDDAEALAEARALIHSAKVGLGERGAVWWTDGAPDYNKHMVHNTPYADWWEQRRPNP
jgi:hypothetical protein